MAKRDVGPLAVIKFVSAMTPVALISTIVLWNLGCLAGIFLEPMWFPPREGHWPGLCITVTCAGFFGACVALWFSSAWRARVFRADVSFDALQDSHWMITCLLGGMTLISLYTWLEE